jgi:hypothetical protein
MSGPSVLKLFAELGQDEIGPSGAQSRNKKSMEVFEK